MGGKIGGVPAESSVGVGGTATGIRLFNGRVLADAGVDRTVKKKQIYISKQ